MDILRSALDSLGFDAAVFWSQFALFFLLHGLLWQVLYKPLGQARSERRARTEGILAEAEKINAEALELKRQWESAVAEARRQAREFLANSRRQAEKERAERVARGREEARRLLEETRASIAADRERVAADLESRVKELSVAIATRLVGSWLRDGGRERVLARIREDGA